MKKLLLLSLVIVFGCSEYESNGYELNQDLVEIIKESDKTEGDFWLEQKGMYEWGKSVLFFGYIDNYQACLDFIEMDKKKYEGNTRCVPVDW